LSSLSWRLDSRRRCAAHRPEVCLATSNRPKRSFFRRLAGTVALAALLWLALSLAAVAALRWLDPPTTAVMLLEPGGIGELEHTWVDRGEIAWNAARAVIAAEDQRFLEHRGIDFVSLDRALADYRGGDGLRGASTITQQVAKNVFLWQGRSFVRKALEAYFAVLIEMCWTKERILEVYLNIAEFGPGVFGVEAAAREYFGSNAAALNVSDAALLAAVLPNPRQLRVSRPSEYVRERQRWIADQTRLLESRGHYRGIDW
jgi:monofunctional biosynthetic peptidoglycan transglycosylase